MYFLIGLIALLTLIGMVMVLSASAVQSIHVYKSPWYYFEHQLVWVAIGVIAFAAAFRTDYRFWRRFGAVSMIVAFVALVAVLIPGIGKTVSGSSRWLGVGPLQIQPSELTKLAFVYFSADVLDRRLDGGRWRYRLGPTVIVLGLLIILLMKQPDMGTSLVIASIALGMLCAAGSPMRILGGMLGGGAVGALALSVVSPYRWARMTSFLHPMHDASGTGYQSVQALASMGQGGLFGSGLGQSVASYGYLPNQQTDFIFAVIAEETGLVGSLFVVALYALLAVVCIRISCRAPDRFGSLVAAGITAWLVAQAVINLGAVVGLLPVTGVPLPFVSYGGSSVVILLFGVGILANVAKKS